MKINIGQNIKRLRAAKDVTQEGLAEAMNVTPAAVSKWERGESYPDITLLQPLAFFFGVSLDELVGYDREKVSADIDKVLEEVKKQWLTDPRKARETLFNAYREYPNDYRLMDAYIWETAGGYADNDPKALLENKDEILKICDRIIDGCTDERIRLDAWNMKAKILHAEGKTDEAIGIYFGKFSDWYQSAPQKCEQLFAKDTPEFMYRLRVNMFTLAEFAADKLAKSCFFDKEIPYEKMVERVERYGDELRRIGLENNEPYFIEQAQSVYGRLHNDLKYRGGENRDKARLLDKYLEMIGKITEMAKNDKPLREVTVAWRETDDLLRWTADYYLGQTDPVSSALKSDPDYMAVLEKYRK